MDDFDAMAFIALLVCVPWLAFGWATNWEK